MSVVLIIVTFAVLDWLESRRSHRALARRARREQPGTRSQTRLREQHQRHLTATRP
jgi:hypothetical protein